MVTVYGNEISTGFTSGESLVAIYTYGCKVWPEAESWTGGWPGPEVHPGDYYIDWTPSDITGVFSISGNNYYLEDYSGHFIDFDNVITSSAFSNIESMQTLDTTARRIERSAFYRCTSLRTASMSQCSYVGYGAFANCINLQSVSLPKCTWIEERGFYDNYILSAVSLPNAAYIGQSAFASCANLNTVYLGPYCSMVGSSAFHSVGYSLSGYTTYILAYRGEGTVGYPGAFGNIGSLYVPAWKQGMYSGWTSGQIKSMIYVKYGNGRDWSNAVDIEKFNEYQITSSNISWPTEKPTKIETDATVIGSSAFQSWYDLYNMSMSQVVLIFDNAFADCLNVDVFAPNIRKIERRGFYNCMGITYMTLSQCSRIGYEAFCGCYSMSYIMLGSKKSFWVSDICELSSRAFVGCENLQAIYVPSSLVASYKAATNWSEYSDIIFPIPQNN